MAEQVRADPGAMLAVRAPEEETRALLEETTVIAAVNAADETVISGDADAIDRIAAKLGRDATRLRVAGAWHSPRIEGAVETLVNAIATARPANAPRTTLVSALDAEPVEPERFARCLGDGLVRPVRFAALCRRLVELGVTEIAIAAPSRALRGLVHRNLGGAVEVHAIERPQDIDALTAQ